MPFKKELLDELLKNYKKPEDLLGENGLLKQLKKAIVERALGSVNKILPQPNECSHKV